MLARFIGFGELEIDGKRYSKDVVIEAGKVRKRDKKPSKVHRGQFGHTPLSAEERLPLGGGQLIIGTGAYGRLPVMPEVLAAAERRGVEVVSLPTDEACELISEKNDEDINAVLHLTC
jgi:hypothetical protein